MRTQIFTVLLAVSMVFSLIPMMATAAEVTSYIALTSDVHGTGGNLENWLTSLQNNGTTSLDYFIFGGDYPTWGQETTAATNAVSYRTMVKEAFNDVPVALTRGNHDTSGDYGNPYDKGAQYNGPEFAVYVLPAYQLDGVSSGVYGGQGFTTSAMNDLGSFLSGIEMSKPVFVASHFPIHYYSSSMSTRTSTNASQMIDLLNEYPNVIFVYGHNHTLGDTNYKLIKTAGDSMQYSASGTKTINFTYTACGGMMDGAEQDIRGLLVTLTDNGDETTMKFQHQNIAGDEKTNKTITLDSSGGTIPTPDPEPGTGDYVLATTVEEGGQYVIVAKSGSNYYALTTDKVQTDFLAAQQITIDGNTIDASSVDASKMVWTFTADGDGYDVMNGGKYLNRDSGSGGGKPEGLFVSTTESGPSYSDWIYNNNELYVYSTSGSTNFNMILGANNSYFQASYEKTQEIYLYKLTTNGTTPTPDPDPIKGDFVLANSVEEGGQYVIVAKSGSNYYALTTDKVQTDYLAAQQVTVDGDKIIASSVNAAKMVWTFTADGDGYNVMNGEKYLNRDSGSGGGKPQGLFVSTTESGSSYSDWIYNNNELYVYSTSLKGNFNMILEENNSYFQASHEETQNIYLYKLTPNGTTPDPDPDPDPILGDYVLASDIEEEGQYLIVAKSGNNYYALTTDKSQDKYLAGQQVTVVNNGVDANSVNAAKMVWTFTADGDGYNVMNGANYLNRSAYDDYDYSDGLILSTTEAEAPYSDWIYSDSKLYTYSINGSTEFYLIFDDGIFFADYEVSREIYLYKLVATEPVTLTDISADFNQGSTIIYPTSDLESLRSNLIVTATYSDGSSTEITGYSLSGALAVGTSIVTVEYEGKTDTFNVTVIEELATQHTVSFDPDNGTPVTTVMVNNGEQVTPPADPSKDNFIFSGWYSGDTLFDFNSAITGDLTLKARWTAITESTIISIPTIESTRGRTISVPIRIENNPGLATLQTVIEYNPNILEPVGLLSGDIWTGSFESNLEYASNQIIIAGASTSLMTGDGNLAVIEFKVKDDANYGEYPVTIDVQELKTLDGSEQQSIPFTKIDGKVKVAAYKIGDVNNDGEIRASDATEILLYVAQMKTFTELQLLAADVNGDGVVTAADATEILLIVARLKEPPVATTSTMQLMGLAKVMSMGNETPVVLEIGSDAGEMGEVVTLPINISENTGLSTFTFHIDYDSTKLKPLSADVNKDWTTEIIDNLNAIDTITGEPMIILTSARSSNWYNDGTFATISFEILEEEAGETYVNLNVQELCYVDGERNVQNLPYAATNGKVEIQALEHVHIYESVVTEPTCEAQGYTTYTCECGDSYVADYTDPTGHDWDEGEVTIEPTTKTEGVKIFTCLVCEATKTETIAKLASNSSRPSTTPPEEFVEVDEPETPLSDLPVANPFIDVLSDAWYYDDVMMAFENGLMNGIELDKFAPGSKLTRAMIVTILWRLDGAPEEENLEINFTDVVKGAYYEQAIAWGAKNEIIFGYGEELFGPNDDITREQLVTILWRYAKYKEMDLTTSEDDNIAKYKDVLDISNYALPAMQWALIEEILTGKPGELLDPQGNATRAETAAMLQRFVSATNIRSADSR
jgi:uncharacterized repeat protein (TIGR02543 family)